MDARAALDQTCASALFAPLIPTTWLPSETLFSLCSRHHRLASHRVASVTCSQLFGHPTMGSAHDLASRIGEFVARTLGQLGSADEVISQRTILPFYLAFASKEIRDKARVAMTGRSIGGLKYQLGILTSRFGANHPLKACAACIAEDQREHRVPFWHIEHQLPGVWVCHRHDQVLMATALKSSGTLRFQWLLPDAADDLKAPGVSPAALPNATALAKASLELWKLASHQALAPLDVAATYRVGLARRGLLTGGEHGQLRHQLTGTEYSRHLAHLREVPELAALPASPASAAAEVARLLRTPRTGIHPVRHLAFMTWCFGSLPAFMDAYRDSQQPNLPCAPPSVVPPSADDARKAEQRDGVLQLLRLGRTPTAAARTVGVDPCTAIAWATSSGLTTTKRPSRMLGQARAKMIAALLGGAAKSEVAALGAVSIESVTRLLRTEVGLHEAWAQARHTKAQEVARSAWLSAIADDRDLGVKGVRLHAPAAYAWLYRNDRDWLDKQAMLIACPRGALGPRVDWDSRDQHLAQALRVAALELSATAPGQRITLGALCAAIPELRAKIRKLSRLPQTERVISELVTRHARTRSKPEPALL